MPGHAWDLRTCQGHCGANHHTWGLTDNQLLCLCGELQCLTLSMSAGGQSFSVVYGPYTVLMTMLVSGLTVAVYAKK